MRALTIHSPAKLNLFLRVVGRYPDGYHKIVTLFHRISLKDTLHLAKRKKAFSLSCAHPGLPTDENNLITKAYFALRQRIPDLGGVHVSLIKRIPVGGGLGGGSSNAAAFLLGMKKLYGLRLRQKEWLHIGSRLGADVPFFLREVNQAIGTGRGDKVTPRPCKRKQWFVLVLSPHHLSTPRVYRGLPAKLPAGSLTKVSRAVKLACEILNRGDRPENNAFMQNDLIPPAVRMQPVIQKVIDAMQRLGVSSAGMSGSGPTVFAIFSGEREARRLIQKLRRAGPFGKIVVCHSV